MTDRYNEAGGLARPAPLNSYDDNSAMDYSIDIPIHPLATSPSPSSSSATALTPHSTSRSPIHLPHPQPQSSNQPLNSEQSSPQTMYLNQPTSQLQVASANTPEIIMTTEGSERDTLLGTDQAFHAEEQQSDVEGGGDGDGDEADDDGDDNDEDDDDDDEDEDDRDNRHNNNKNNNSANNADRAEHNRGRLSNSPTVGERGRPLVVDTASAAKYTNNTSGNRGLIEPHMLDNLGTPGTAPLTPDTGSTPTTATTAGTTAPTSRRSSLRPATATLPRSALQEETIALFKQHRNLIPCAKCLSRNTIQRDGMSDGNLRFKCRPPVSMSLICNKSYSESKIRNMIAGVVYGPSLPSASTPSSASSENILALPPPPLPSAGGPAKFSRRSSQKHQDLSKLTPERLRQMQEDEDMQDQDGQLRQHGSKADRDRVYPRDPDMDSGHLSDDMHGVRSRHGPMGPAGSFRRRSSFAGGEDTASMEYESPSLRPPPSHPGHLQVPRTPPHDGDDPRFSRSSQASYAGPPAFPPLPPSAIGHRGRQGPKLHHSHSHPNIGQQRHQQYLEQQEMRARSGHSGGVNMSSSQSRPSLRQEMRRDSAPYPGGNFYGRVEAERRFSYPAIMPPSGDASTPDMPTGYSKHSSSLAPKDEALSPALSSSPRSSPGRDPSVHSSGTPRIQGVESSFPGSTPIGRHLPGGRFDENSSSSPFYQRRMSQPHPTSRQSHGQLPPPLPPGAPSNMYLNDRRASEAEIYSHVHSDKYEKWGTTILSPRDQSQAQQQPYPPQGLGLRTTQAEPMRISRSMPGSQAGSHEALASMATSASNVNTSVGGRNAYPSSNQLSTPSSASVYYKQSRRENMDTLDPHSHHSPQSLYQDRFSDEAESRPYAKMRQVNYRKSHPQLSADKDLDHQGNDLDSVLPRNTIKLTCFPNSSSPNGSCTSPTQSAPATVPLDTSSALAMQINQSSKLVIEISQSRPLQFSKSTLTKSPSLGTGLGSLTSTPTTEAEPLFRKTIRNAVSQPNLNLFARTTSSVLGQRRSISPDATEFGSSKKRRANSVSGSKDDDLEEISSPAGSALASVAAAEAAAAAVVAAAAKSAAAAANGHANRSVSSLSPSVGLQIVGVDYDHSKTGADSTLHGLGLTNMGADSPTIEALGVAKASSFVLLEDQKELGIDYSLFTRVETASWRILIPPNVTASFHSDDFALTLKPKEAGIETEDDKCASLLESVAETCLGKEDMEIAGAESSAKNYGPGKIDCFEESTQECLESPRDAVVAEQEMVSVVSEETMGVVAEAAKESSSHDLAEDGTSAEAIPERRTTGRDDVEMNGSQVEDEEESEMDELEDD